MTEEFNSRVTIGSRVVLEIMKIISVKKRKKKKKHFVAMVGEMVTWKTIKCQTKKVKKANKGIVKKPPRAVPSLKGWCRKEIGDVRISQKS